jgi:hypothetical protein
MKRNISEIKFEAEQHLNKYHELMKEAEALSKKRKEQRQTRCRHLGGYRTEIEHYVEEGRMAGPIYSSFRTCKLCGKRLGVYVKREEYEFEAF